MGFIQRVKDNSIDAQPMTPQNLCIKMLLPPLFPMISKQIAGRLKNKGQRNMRWIRGGNYPFLPLNSYHHHCFNSYSVFSNLSLYFLEHSISLTIVSETKWSEHFKITLKCQENVKTDTHLTAFDKLELIAFLRRFQIWAPYNRTPVLATHSQ